MTVLRPTSATLRRHMTAIAAALVLSLAAPASALTVRIDFEDDSGTPAAGWNMFDSTDSGATLDLIDTTGADSGIDIRMPNVFDNNGAFDGWDTASNPLPGWAPDEVADDYVYSTSLNTNFYFYGLDVTLTYDITLIVSRDLDRTQSMRLFTGAGNLNENGWNSQADGYVAGNVVSFIGVTPRADGSLRLRLRRVGSASSNLNAVQIQSVPEPARLGLLAASAVLLGALRRR
ncbi:MAG: PEP-CTERM sorting domain-containing protein [Myxococcales bacterium]|nr:PEP-CTERM sorting domain-containing protein [Myxococcales bacterium]